MGKVKEYITGRLEAIERKTGYDFFFLQAKYFEQVADGASIEVALDHIDTVSVERDW